MMENFIIISAIVSQHNDQYSQMVPLLLEIIFPFYVTIQFLFYMLYE